MRKVPEKFKRNPVKFRRSYNKKRYEGNKKPEAKIGKEVGVKPPNDFKTRPIQTVKEFRKGYSLQHGNDLNSIVFRINDLHGSKGTEEADSKKRTKMRFETKSPFDESEIIHLEKKLRLCFIEAQVDTMGKDLRVTIKRRGPDFRKIIEKEKEEERRLSQIEKERKEREEKFILENQRKKNEKETGHRETNKEREEREEREERDRQKKLEFQKYPERRFAWIKELGRTKGFQSTYVIELKPEISKSESEEAYPSKNLTEESSEVDHGPFPQSEMFTDGSRCFYVGQTGHLIEERFYQSKHAHMKKKRRVKKFRKITDEHPYVQSIEHMKSLTGEYGFERSRGGNKSLKFEHYVAWALYKCGYRTWGPTVKELKKNNISTDREWLGEYPFL